jgi:predicted dithiol-disulfide oxidoreductase (DUF899 family)
MTEREQAVAAAMLELAAARKRMSMVRVEGKYRFEGPDGERSLLELFDGRSQLILYRFFFEEGVARWPDAGCVGCSSFADRVPELGLLRSRDITFAMALPAPQANLRRYAERMGWTDVPWYTSGGDNDLPAGVAVSEVADRLWNLVEWERPVDDRPDRAGFEQRPQLRQVLAALS